MRNKSIIVFLALLILFLYSQGQDSQRRWLEFHVMPLTLIDLTPRLRVGVEYRNDRFAYCLDMGLGNAFLNKGRLDGLGWSSDYQFLELRPEFKIYILKLDHRLGSFYTSGELFLLMMRDELVDNYFHLENYPYVTYYDQARFNKIKSGLHLKAGMRVVLFQRFDVDFYFGLGPAYRLIDYTHVVNGDVRHDDIWYEWWIPRYKFEGDNFILHMTMGCKLGLSLNKFSD